jgi:SAM-dependent methyltransferase
MTLSLDGRVEPVSSPALSRALAASSELWAWVDEGCASGRLRSGDAVQIVGVARANATSRSARLLPVVDAGGAAIVTDPDDARAPLGFVRAVWRGRRPWPLDEQPWRSILASGSVRRWRIAERMRAMTVPVIRTLEQLGKTPRLDDVEASEATFYDRPEIVADYERVTEEGLSPAEESVTARFLNEGARVLVVGCGTGREAFAFARRGMHVVGIDISGAAVATARRRATELIDVAGTVSFENVSLMQYAPAGAPFDFVLVASDVLCGIPGTANRIAALTRARQAARVGAHVVVAARSGRGPLRVLLEAPRAALGLLGLGDRERGDRFAWDGPPATRRFFHVYGDDVELANELAYAGLAYDGRVAGFVVARCEDRARAPAAGVFETALETALETARVLTVLPRVERARRRSGPGPLAVEMRLIAKGAPHRDALGRARLRGTIAACDRILPPGAGCYRRALLEMALDAGAAGEPLVLGLRRHGLGHAWVGGPDTEESFDWVVRL